MTEKPLIIAGPCSVDTEYRFKSTLDYLLKYDIKYIRVGLHKPRTSPHSFQGLGEQAYNYISQLKKTTPFVVVSEILSESDFAGMDTFVDIYQVGSRNMDNYNLLKYLSKNTTKPVLLKRGASATVSEYLSAADYLNQTKANNTYLCLRGIRTFEQIDSVAMRNTPDLATILTLKDHTPLPILFDPSHSTGNYRYVNDVARAALVLGADGLMIETCTNPETALCDGQQSLNQQQFHRLLEQINYF